MLMSPEPPEVIIRVGSHAEKEYVLKLKDYLDGLIVGANLFEAAPGATASLLLAAGAKTAKLYIDPMTYAFGEYIDPDTGKVRNDLDWIKSDQIPKGQPGKKRASREKTTIREFKRSYRALAETIGWPLNEAVQKSAAVTPDLVRQAARIKIFSGSVVDYQLRRLQREFEEDEELKDFIDDMPKPAAVFAPYFYVEPTNTDAWLDVNLRLMQATAALGAAVPIHGVLCADVRHLADAGVRQRLLEAVPQTGVSGVWLWFSGFFEESASREVLTAYRGLVEGLATRIEVRAMHGGFFGLTLSKFGMRGVSHGIGYGEQKDVVPVIGQSTPTVRYYLPPIARRLGVPEIERAFDDDFHKKVCGCAVCKGVISTSLDQFASFGDMHFSRPTAQRLAQTPAAAKRCRFHFLLSRLGERDWVRKLSVKELATRLEQGAGTWGVQPTLKSSTAHLMRWVSVLLS
jgi:hypothetical protein